MEAPNFQSSVKQEEALFEQCLQYFFKASFEMVVAANALTSDSIHLSLIFNDFYGGPEVLCDLPIFECDLLIFECDLPDFSV